ncbi:MAG: hypothetical protein NZ772_14805 [Cyanobacteria bacterium]|nr:hypothetical protein [Cyanobacteriota bacterium]MDW8202645.1 hypothetical protein [Cyanobacteriota bacterium SKYGB_h_bin112]
MSSSNFASELEAFQRLRDFRAILLRLHKALLESERVTYEQEYGVIASSGEFFRLVIDHEWFAWLRPMSQFIVQIDDLLSPKASATLAQAEALLTQAQDLITPHTEGTLDEHRYVQAIQRDPNVAMLYADAARVLRV